MTAIILAGGFGTRLQSVVSDVPKPMAPVNNKPFLAYILQYLKHNNITKILLSVGYKHEIIEKYFGHTYLGMSIKYVIEDKALGTGGAIKKALAYTNDNELFIINGDTFFDVDLGFLKQQFMKIDSKLFLSLKQMHNFDRYGCVETNEEQEIIAFKEKESRKTGNINGGIYLITKEIFNGYNLPDVFSFEAFMQEEFNALNAMALVFNTYFIDIGIPDDYAKAQIELRKYI